LDEFLDERGMSTPIPRLRLERSAFTWSFDRPADPAHLVGRDGAQISSSSRWISLLERGSRAKRRSPACLQSVAWWRCGTEVFLRRAWSLLRSIEFARKNAGGRRIVTDLLDSTHAHILIH